MRSGVYCAGEVSPNQKTKKIRIFAKLKLSPEEQAELSCVENHKTTLVLNALGFLWVAGYSCRIEVTNSTRDRSFRSSRNPKP